MNSDDRRAVEIDIERLIKRYVNLNDAQDWNAVADLYTEDARFARPSKPGEFIVGREAILASFLARPPRAQRHVIANTVVDVEGPATARAFSVIVLYQGDPAPQGALPTMSADSPIIGTFTDRLALTEDGWRFAERVGGLDFKP
ncbi:MAG: nuclear transport factor 2 family protein [Croceibacterium sp.]